MHHSIMFRGMEHIKLDGNVFIGENSRLFCIEQYVIGNTGEIQRLHPVLRIGDNFHATRNLTIQCAGCIEIGKDVLVASDVFITDFNHGLNPQTDSYLDNPLELGRVMIEDGVWIGNSVTILSGVTIGKKAVIAAGAVVAKDIEPYTIAAGVPAKVIKKFNPDTQKWKEAQG